MTEYNFETAVAAIKDIRLTESDKKLMWQRLLRMEKRQEPDLSKLLVQNLAIFSVFALILVTVFVGGRLNFIPAKVIQRDSRSDALKQTSITEDNFKPVNNETNVVAPAVISLPASTEASTTIQDSK